MRPNRLVLAALSVALAACGGLSGGSNEDAVTAALPVVLHVKLPLRNSDALDTLLQAQQDQTSTSYRQWLTPAQFRAAYGPSTSDLAAAETYLKGQGFTTRRTSQGIVAQGRQDHAEATFQSKIARSSTGIRATPIVLPAALAKLGATVSLGSLKKHVHSKRASGAVPANRYSAEGPYWFTDLKEAYGYPSFNVANGVGAKIAIVIDSDVLDTDTAMYFGHEQIATPPAVVRRPVLGGPPAFDPNGDSAEASLDVQMSLGSAPGASVLLYAMPDLSDASITAAYQQIVDDGDADVVSSSFGACELYYTKAYNAGTDFTSILTQQHDIFRQGNAQGISFVVSSGDNGAYDCLDVTTADSGIFTASSSFVKGVETPAGDTNVTAVGGTNLLTQTLTKNGTATRDSHYASENANFDQFDPAQGAIKNEIWGSGGGISTLFARPWYQALVHTGSSMRTVPDVSMHMGGCPEGAVTPCDPARSAVVTAIGGQFFELIGTSASAPEFAGLLAVTEQVLGTRLGNANGYVYALAALEGTSVFRQGIAGNNGYKATAGYNYVLGNGTPHAAAFMLMPNAPLAGVPWSASNP